jgi:DNA processing protein
MKIDRIKAYLSLNLIEHQARILLAPLLEAGYDPEEIMDFSRLKWEEYYSKTQCHRIIKARFEMRLDAELEFLMRHKVGLLPLEDPDYPPLLREIYNPPNLLYTLGKLPPRDAVHIALVGARDSTVAGKCIASELGRFLSQQGISTVSGFARGIDRAAHRGVLESQPRGYAVGIIASGIGEFLKPKLQDFYTKILENGAVFSEFPSAFHAAPRNFPIRNRIITGMSLATIIVEAKIRSGSMVSARLALEQGREVFAVPGPMHSELSEGTHQLIRSGATLLSRAEDLIEDLNLDSSPRSSQALSTEESFLIERITKAPLPLEKLLYQSQKPLSWLMKHLLCLEQKGLIKRLPGDHLCLM